MDKTKTLYWVKFVDQSDGRTIDTHFLARNLAHLEEEISDILQIKVISDVSDLTVTINDTESMGGETDASN